MRAIWQPLKFNASLCGGYAANLIYAVFCGLWLCAAALAQEQCAPLADKTDEREALFEALRRSSDEEIGRAAADAIWQMWTAAPDAKAQDLLDRGMSALRTSWLEQSETILKDLIDYCPDYPEGWNQRAFARFLRGDYEGSLADIETTLKLEPQHFGALAGQALILIQTGEVEQAKSVLRRAVAINPWLNERKFLQENPAKDI